jgi:hypothetical protein
MQKQMCGSTIQHISPFASTTFVCLLLFSRNSRLTIKREGFNFFKHFFILVLVFNDTIVILCVTLFCLILFSI